MLNFISFRNIHILTPEQTYLRTIVLAYGYNSAYYNPRDAIGRHCNADGVVKHDVIDSMGRTQRAKFITEGNLYRLITHSKLPKAEQFEKWVFDEVLPTIRQTGGFGGQVLKMSIKVPLDRRAGDCVAVHGAEPGNLAEVQCLLLPHECQHH